MKKYKFIGKIKLKKKKKQMNIYSQIYIYVLYRQLNDFIDKY